MGAKTSRTKEHKNFLDIATAASQAGYSPRHFRRIIEEAGIPMVQIGRKSFVVARDFQAWKLSRDAKVGPLVQQLGRWIEEKAKDSARMVDEIRDED